MLAFWVLCAMIRWVTIEPKLYACYYLHMKRTESARLLTSLYEEKVMATIIYAFWKSLFDAVFQVLLAWIVSDLTKTDWAEIMRIVLRNL